MSGFRFSGILLGLMFFIPMLLMSTAAEAQTGWIAPLHANANSLNGILPPVNQPQAGWTPTLDLKSSDGTAAVPTCDDPLVVATVRDGILNSSNDKWSSQGGSGQLVQKIALSTIWVHPTYSNGTVCDMQVQLDVPMTEPEEWEFQPFAENGEVNVFFYNKDSQQN